MRTLASLTPGGQLVLTGHLEVARVGPTRRPVLRVVAMDPVTLRPIYADVDQPPPTPEFVVDHPRCIEGDTRPVVLTPAPWRTEEHRRQIREFVAALRRWGAERRAAGQLADEPPRYLATTPIERLRHWV